MVFIVDFGGFEFSLDTFGIAEILNAWVNFARSGVEVSEDFAQFKHSGFVKFIIFLILADQNVGLTIQSSKNLLYVVLFGRSLANFHYFFLLKN
jgi:hypothetical protein